MAIQIANIGIDPPDVLVNIDADIAMEEDLSVNDIESLVELLLETCLDIENAIPETEDPESDNMIKKIDFYSLGKPVICSVNKPVIKNNFYFEYNKFFSSPAFDIAAPPPKTA